MATAPTSSSSSSYKHLSLVPMEFEQMLDDLTFQLRSARRAMVAFQSSTGKRIDHLLRSEPEFQALLKLMNSVASDASLDPHPLTHGASDSRLVDGPSMSQFLDLQRRLDTLNQRVESLPGLGSAHPVEISTRDVPLAGPQDADIGPPKVELRRYLDAASADPIDPVITGEEGEDSAVSIWDQLAQLDQALGVGHGSSAASGSGPGLQEAGRVGNISTPSSPLVQPTQAREKGTRDIYFHNLSDLRIPSLLRLRELCQDIAIKELDDEKGVVVTAPRSMTIESLKPFLAAIRTTLEQRGIRPLIRVGGQELTLLKVRDLPFTQGGMPARVGEYVPSSMNDVRREIESKHRIIGLALVRGGKGIFLTAPAEKKRKNPKIFDSGGGSRLESRSVAIELKGNKTLQVQAYLSQMADPTKLLLFGKDTVVEIIQLYD